jgi:hypothetical protein
MSKKSTIPVGSIVRTKSGLQGEVIGTAEYKYFEPEVRIKIPGKKKTLYRKESEVTVLHEGTASMERMK